MKLLVAILSATLVGSAVASCPNACSGHGSCGANDMCTCYRNWQSADCSTRVCPYGVSFTTTPQGDLNMDGDRFDASMKPIVHKSGSSAGDPILASIPALSNQLTFNADIVSGELTKGDCLVIANQKYCVSAESAVSPLSVFSMDADNGATAIKFQPVYKFVETIARPGGSWEAWPGHAVSNWKDDGHFYMECSNQGTCDRSTGECSCFDGYSGRACARASCPGGCNGHGTCKTINELAVSSPTKLSFGVDVSEGSSFVAASADPVGSLARGDKVYLGEQHSFVAANLYMVGQVSEAGFQIMPPARDTLSFGSTAYHAAAYSLWDGDKNQACDCDAGYSGYDCSQRMCPHGSDPLDKTGEDYSNTLSMTSVGSTYTKSEERQTLEITSTCGATDGTIDLTWTDSHTGEKLSTGSISLNPELSSTVAIHQPQYLDTSYCTTAASVATCFKKISFTPHLPTKELSAGDRIRVANQIRVVDSINVDTTSGNISYAMVNDAYTAAFGAGTYAYRLNAAQAIKEALEGLPNGAVVVATVDQLESGTGMTNVFSSHGAASNGWSTVSIKTSANAASTLDPDMLCAGDHVHLASTYYRQVDDISSLQAANAGAGNVGISSFRVDGIASAVTHTSGNLQNVVTRVSGNGRYQIKTDIDGDTNDLACDASGARAVFSSSRAGYVSRAEPRKVWFVDATYGSNQPQVKSLVRTDSNHPETLTGGDVIFVGGQRCDVVAVDHSGEFEARGIGASGVSVGAGKQVAQRTGGRMAFAVCAEPLSATAHSTATAISVNDPVQIQINGATLTCGATDYRTVDFQSGAPTTRSHVSITEHIAGSDDNRKVSNVPRTAAIAAAAGGKHQVTLTVHGLAVNDYVFIRDSDNNDGVRQVTDIVDADNFKFANAGNGDEASPFSITVQLSTGAAPAFMDTSSSHIWVGQRVMVETSTGQYEVRTIDSIDSNKKFFTVSKGFSASHDNKRLWIVGKGSKTAAECGNRGLCDSEAGLCKCFKGYSKQACQEQQALAA